MKEGTVAILAVCLVTVAAATVMAQTTPSQGEELYRFLSKKTITEGDTAFVENLNAKSRESNWPSATEIELTGSLRILKAKDGAESRVIYFIRGIAGDIYIVSFPAEGGRTQSEYEKMSQNRMMFILETVPGEHEGRYYTFARIVGEPKAVLLDRIFKILIVLMLFFVMVGMGLNLKASDFTLVFRKPIGIVLGVGMQYGVMPLVALGLSYLFGYYHAYPFIYLGLILAMASPAGVVSNLFTHYAKGDLALSISLTSISTVFALFFMPMLLSIYGNTGSGATVPTMLKRGTGTIINVSSLRAFGPGRRVAVYSGTKAFLNNFPEAIHIENMGEGIKIQVLCPGFTRTDFHDRIGLETSPKNTGLVRWMSTAELVEISFRYLKKNKVICIPGLWNKLMILGQSIMPAGLYYMIAPSNGGKKEE